MEKLKQFIKANQSAVIIAVVILILIGGWFYWFQWRPATIKHDCSWVKRHTEATLGRLAKTEEELNYCKAECQKLPSSTNLSPSGYQPLFSSKQGCLDTCGRDAQAEQPTPAKDWWEPASSQEYSFCLHHKGL